MRKFLLAGAVVVAAVLGTACIPAEEPWTAWDTGPAAGETGWTPEAPRNPAMESRIIDNRNVDLLWRPNRPNQYLGTSVETDNLGLDVEPGDVISVTYSLSSSITDDEANLMPAGGAIRLFAYDGITHPTDQAPTYVATAPTGCRVNCPLSFEVTEAGELQYAGLVYDTSNGGVQGRVRFTDLEVTRASGGDPQLLLFE